MERNKIGRAAFHGTIGLLVALSQPFAANAADCKPDLLANVRLHIEPDGQLFLPATIGGRPVYFALLMGSGLPTLVESSAKSLGLTQRPISGTGVFPSGITHYAKLEELKVGNFLFANRAAPIIPEPGVDAPRMLEDRLVAGTMGSTLFQRVDVELNLAEGQLKLFKPFRCLGHSPVYWGGEAASLPIHFDEAGVLVFTLEVNGRRVESGMLSGMRDSTIDANAAREFFGFDENSPDVEFTDSGPGNPRRTIHAMSLTGPGLQIAQTRVQLRPGGCKLTASKAIYHAIGYTACVNGVPFKLGIDLLSQMRIYVATQRKAMFVTIIPKQPPTQ